MGTEERPVLGVKNNVFLESSAVTKAHSTHSTAERPRSSMDVDVLQKPVLLSKRFSTIVTMVGPLACMCPHVTFQIKTVPEVLPTLRAAMSLGMTPTMLGQVLLRLKSLVTVKAAKRLKGSAVVAL